MMNLATSYGISHVAIFPGAVPHEDIPSYLSAADAYIALPESDATSVALLEAMASSLPVIVSDLPSNREWITDGDNGFLIPTGDRAGLIEKILVLIENGNLRKRMGKKNQRLVQKKADHGRHMIQMNEIYSAWLHRSR